MNTSDFLISRQKRGEMIEGRRFNYSRFLLCQTSGDLDYQAAVPSTPCVWEVFSLKDGATSSSWTCCHTLLLSKTTKTPRLSTHLSFYTTIFILVLPAHSQVLFQYVTGTVLLYMHHHSLTVSKNATTCFLNSLYIRYSLNRQRSFIRIVLFISWWSSYL